nr:MAG TPA: hypothetical protein [Crassvirales sp.]
MPKTKNMDEKVEYSNVGIDNIPDMVDMELQEVSKPITQATEETKATKVLVNTDQLVNCLRNERICIKHIPKQSGMITDHRHVLYGGMAETAKRTFTVPLLKSGAFADVLTKKEKDFLEYTLGLEVNAMSVYRTNNNFWSTANTNGISSVTLFKQDNFFDLSDPTDYIKYKILLANKDFVAPSLQTLQDQPKATYEFVVVSDIEKTKVATSKMSYKKQCYKELGKVEDNIDIMRLIIETIDGRPTAKSTKLELLQTKADDLIQANAGLFLKVITDPLLPTKVLIKKAVEAGVIANRGNYLYLRDGNIPLCNEGQDPTLNVAAMFLNEPKHQDLKFTIEAKLK